MIRLNLNINTILSFKTPNCNLIIHLPMMDLNDNRYTFPYLK